MTLVDERKPASRLQVDRTDLAFALDDGIACTSPITAAVAAFPALGAKRIALLTPYIARINHMMRDWIEARGIEVPVMGTYNHENDNEVARISGPSIRSAVLELGRHQAV